MSTFNNFFEIKRDEQKTHVSSELIGQVQRVRVLVGQLGNERVLGGLDLVFTERGLK